MLQTGYSLVPPAAQLFASLNRSETLLGNMCCIEMLALAAKGQELWCRVTTDSNQASPRYKQFSSSKPVAESIGVLLCLTQNGKRKREAMQCRLPTGTHVLLTGRALAGCIGTLCGIDEGVVRPPPSPLLGVFSFAFNRICPRRASRSMSALSCRCIEEQRALQS